MSRSAQTTPAALTESDPAELGLLTLTVEQLLPAVEESGGTPTVTTPHVPGPAGWRGSTATYPRWAAGSPPWYATSPT